jgi:hypothetical protein
VRDGTLNPHLAESIGPVRVVLRDEGIRLEIGGDVLEGGPQPHLALGCEGEHDRWVHQKEPLAVL